MSKNTTALLIIISFFFPQFIFAISPIVNDPANLVVNTKTSVESTIQTATGAMGIMKEFGLDGLAYALAQTAGAKLSNKIWNKANGGAGGDDSNPSFINDFNNYFSNLDRATVTKYLGRLEVSNNPYAEGVARIMVGAYAESGAQIPEAIGGFDLGNVIDLTRFEEFKRDATVGGYEGLLAMSNPANTAMGSHIIAMGELSNAIETARKVDERKTTTSGLLPQGQCTMNFEKYTNQVKQIKSTRENVNFGREYYNETNNTESESLLASLDTRIKTLEAEIKSIQGRIDIKQMELATPQTGQVTETPANREARIKGEITALQLSLNEKNSELAQVQGNRTSTQNMRQGNYTASRGLAEEFGQCVSEFIKNPLSMVETGVRQGAEYAINQLQQSDELSEMIAGMFLTMFNSMIQGGISTLRADFQSASNPENFVGGPEQLTTTNGQTLNWTESPQNIVDLKKDFDPAITNTTAEVENIREYINIINGRSEVSNKNLPKLIAGLDMCIPGPDVDFSKKLDDYIQTKTQKLQRKMNSGREIVQETRTETMSIIDEISTISKINLELWSTDPSMNIPGASYMKDEVTDIESIKTIYTRKRNELVERQTALNTLTNIENELKGSLNLLPNEIIPANIKTIIPFSKISWDKLSDVNKNTLLNWVKNSNKNPDGTLAEITVPLETSSDQYVFVSSYFWDIWEYPEKYFTTENTKNDWNYSQGVLINQGTNDEKRVSKAQNFMNEKNKIRSSFHLVGSNISTQFSINNSKQDITNLQMKVIRLENLTSDCTTIRQITAENSHLRNSSNGHETLRNIFIQEASKVNSRFKTDAIKNSFRGTSILTTDPTKFPENIECPTGAGRCKLDIDIRTQPNDGDDEVFDDLIFQINSLGNGNNFQKNPPRNIWEIFNQDNGTNIGTFLCPFTEFMRTYTEVKRVSAKPMNCDESSDWYRTSESKIVNYFFRDTLQY